MNTTLHSTPEEYLANTPIPKDIEQRVRKLQTRNNWYGFFALAMDWLIIAIAIYLAHIIPTIWMYLISIVLIGSRMRGLDNMTHEASHAMLFKNRFLNRWISSFFATFPVLKSFSTYRKSHFMHHRHLWTEKDPDFIRYKLNGLDQPVEKGWRFILKHVIRPLILIHVPGYIKGAISANFFSQDETISERCIRIGYWLLIISASILFGFWKELILFWLVPLLTTYQVISYWVEMGEHAGLKSQNALFASRNSFGGFLSRFLFHPHNDPYHLVHHLYPAVPHYNIKKAHLILMEFDEYRKAHHCMGFFKPFSPGFPSVIEDIQKGNGSTIHHHVDQSIS
ncbi:fatty acid desaturase family protein [Hazenella coriacea]|uniref:Fatty acid desaturase n=1 Tax=Hazenella coriacea TaxID=1179467 RepID=A0A4R3LB65_9BACL|nr:fatty acid desaturase family protein [Hazenella coriacea]TCS97009.1 fatty acid desaturase [Hazenella coriacea]